MATRGTGPAEDAPRGTVRHVPVLLPQVLQALAPAAGGSYIDATFGAGGYSQAILRPHPARACWASTATRRRLRQGRRSSNSIQGRLTLVEGRFGELDRIAGEARVRARRWRGARHRRLLDAARRSRARLLLPGGGPLDMRMSATGRTPARAPPTSSIRPKRRSWPTSSSIWARSEARGPSPAPSSPIAGSSRSRAPWSLPAWWRAFWGARRSAAGMRRRAPSRRCASTSTTSWASWPAPSPLPSACSQPGGRLAGRHLPLARGPAGQAVPQAAHGGRSRTARAICRRRQVGGRPRVSGSLTIAR